MIILYECEFALCDGEIKLIRPIGSKNYCDIIANTYFLKDNVTVEYQANLSSFLTDDQINAVLDNSITKSELIKVFNNVIDEYGEIWLNDEINNTSLYENNQIKKLIKK